MVRSSTLGHHHKEVLNPPERFLTDAGCSVLKKITLVDLDNWVVIGVSGGLWNQSNRIRWFGIFSKAIAFWLGIWCHRQSLSIFILSREDRLRVGSCQAQGNQAKYLFCFYIFDSIVYSGLELIGRLDFSMVGNCSSSDLWISLAPTVMVTSLVNWRNMYVFSLYVKEIKIDNWFSDFFLNELL